jgi:carboxypeptidase Taq
MIAEDAYRELVRRTRELSLLLSCAEVLGWDELTFMPPGGIGHRADQRALLAGLHHVRATDPRLGELLGVLESSDLVKDPESPAAVNVREVRWSFDRATRLPRALVEELARVTALAERTWEVARAQNDFGHFRPWLERVLRLVRQRAACLGYQAVPYDALLEDYEPGLRTADLIRLFGELSRELIPLVASLADSSVGEALRDSLSRGEASHGVPRLPETDILHRHFPPEHQRAFGEAVASALGFDFRGGRMDTSVHPFTSYIGPGDCRITTRFRVNDFSEGLFAILHEVGHGLYDQGLPVEHHGTPLGEPVSLGVHEAQARLWENLVGRSRGFWQHFLPLARRSFPGTFDDVSPEDIFRAVNRVEPGPNRVRADEVTYNLHILIRFELEVALVSGGLQPADVPAAWNEAYRRSLGVIPPSDTEGCLQDGHWADGLFGYFPTYTLGNLFAAQIFTRVNEELGDLEEPFARGDFGGLLGWLREKIHRQGKRYRAFRLMERATGATLDPGPFLKHLRDRYEALTQR